MAQPEILLSCYRSCNFSRFFQTLAVQQVQIGSKQKGRKREGREGRREGGKRASMEKQLLNIHDISKSSFLITPAEYSDVTKRINELNHHIYVSSSTY